MPSDPRVHFGLGAATRGYQVEIHWPSGTIEKVKLPSVDRIFTVEEGKGMAGERCVACQARPASATK